MTEPASQQRQSLKQALLQIKAIPDELKDELGDNGYGYAQGYEQGFGEAAKKATELVDLSQESPSGDGNETKRAALIAGWLYFWLSHELLGSYAAIPDRERITLGTYR